MSHSNGHSSSKCQCHSSNNVCDNIDALRDELCEARANLAAAKANLLNLARIMCLSNNVTPTEKEVLLALDCNLDSINSDLAHCNCYAKALDDRLC